MYTNTPVITVFEKTVGSDHLPVYLPHTYAPAYWEQQTGQRMNKNANASSMAQNYAIYAAIPAKAITGYMPKYEDLICRGYAEIPDESACYTVMTVTDCLYGSPAVQHIEVTAT